MKQIKLAILFLAVTFIGTGCLKDEGFDNHEYGINDPDATPLGVGFNLGTKSIVSSGVTLSNDPQILDPASVLISLLNGRTSSSDIHITIVSDTGLVGAYNRAHNTNLIPLDPATYSLNPDAVIPAGSYNGYPIITFPTTAPLDPNNVYGLGLRITSADAGYLVASNEDEIVLSIAIRNQYDGLYISNGYVYHPSAPRAITNLEKSITTVDANTVACDLGDLGGAGYFAYFTVDPTTNHLTITAGNGAAGGSYTQFDSGLPTSSPGYTPQWPGSPLCTNDYVPGAGVNGLGQFRVRYGYVGGTGWRVTEELLDRE
jgi:hypothetical protein